MRLKPWIWPAAAALTALAAVVLGLLLVDRLGERAIAHQQAAMATAARDYFVAFAEDEGVPSLAKTLNRYARVGSADGFRYALRGRRGRTIAGADVSDTARRQVLSQPLGDGYTLIVAEDLQARDALRKAVFRGSALAIVLAALGAAAPARAATPCCCAAPATSPIPPSGSPAGTSRRARPCTRAATSSTTWARRSTTC
jgi:hypothetical protein